MYVSRKKEGLVFKHQPLISFDSISEVKLDFYKNCCVFKESITLKGKLNPEINSTVKDLYMSNIEVVQFKNELNYEVIGARVMDNNGLIHLVDINSLEAWGVLDGRSFSDILIETNVLGSIESVLASLPDPTEDTDSYYRIVVSGAINWRFIGLLVRDSDNNCLSLNSFTQYSEEGIYWGYNSITLNPSFLNGLKDGIYRIGITIDDQDTVFGAYFIDDELKCKIVDYLSKDFSNHIYRLHKAILYGINCNLCDFEKLCRIYKSILKGFNKDKNNDCGCY